VQESFHTPHPQIHQGKEKRLMKHHPGPWVRQASVSATKKVFQKDYLLVCSMILIE
jgi:hypothetical protein